MIPDDQILHRELKKPRVCGPSRKSYVASLTNVAAPTDPEFDACQICHAAWTEDPGEAIMNTGCQKHGDFHRSCLVPWLQNACTCPTCRKGLFLDYCSKFSPLIPVRHHTESWHQLSLAGLFGHPASEYRTVLAVLTYNFVLHGPTVEECRINITPSSTIELHNHIPDMELFTLTIHPNLEVHVRDFMENV